MYVTSHAWHRRQMHVMKRGFYKSAYIKEKSTCNIKKNPTFSCSFTERTSHHLFNILNLFSLNLLNSYFIIFVTAKHDFDTKCEDKVGIY